MTAVDLESPRERKKAATHVALREAAVELCAARGADAVSVTAICDRAGVARRTFFNYFASKDEAIIGWGRQDHQELVDAILARPLDEDAVTAVEAALCDLLDSATTSPIWRAQIDLLRVYPALRERFSILSRDMESSVGVAVAERHQLPVDDPSVTVTSAALVAVARTAFTSWFDEPTSDFRQLMHVRVDVLRTACRLTNPPTHRKEATP